ncbi:MAG TPA: 4-alpha-glucanotransferase, partial [Piscinibacter sp.]|nr:4-alpha-glucanotransferase [Piscinibacter sp.]
MRFPRRSGILLHPTSLPGPHGSGDLGPEAHRFVDWLAEAGQTLWQVLPLGGIGPGNSPYMSSSAFAGNVLLIDLGELQQRGWLGADDVAPVPGLDAQRIDFGAMV